MSAWRHSDIRLMAFEIWRCHVKSTLRVGEIAAHAAVVVSLRDD